MLPGLKENDGTGRPASLQLGERGREYGGQQGLKESLLILKKIKSAYKVQTEQGLQREGLTQEKIQAGLERHDLGLRRGCMCVCVCAHAHMRACASVAGSG